MSGRNGVKTRPQVFLSFAMADRELAKNISAALTRAGVEVVGSEKTAAGFEYNNDIRQALHRSDAVVVALSGVDGSRNISANVLFELGAASGAGKPIFIVSEEPGMKLPFHVAQLTILPMNRVEEIARELLAA